MSGTAEITRFQPLGIKGDVHRLTWIEEFLARTENVFGEDFDG